MMLLVMAIILCVIFIAGGFSANPDERFFAAMTLTLILILPLGSNNYTFPVLNCLFVIAPAVLWMLRRIWQETRDIGGHFAWHGMAMMILVMVMVQGALFHWNFAFRDGTDGTKRSAQVGRTLRGQRPWSLAMRRAFTTCCSFRRPSARPGRIWTAMQRRALPKSSQTSLKRRPRLSSCTIQRRHPAPAGRRWIFWERIWRKTPTRLSMTTGCTPCFFR